jgi:peptidoglycan hydrolase-like protein with peptidoglycan-binding domain
MSSGVRLRRRRTGRVAVVTVSVLAVGVAAVAANGFGFSDDHGTDGGRAASVLPPATAKIARQTLVDTQTESGELGYGDATTVADRLGGTLTWLPSTGSTLRRGQSIYRVDNAPVVLLYGAIPAYRALSPGTKGADVKQFEQNLYALGYRGFTVDNKYSTATAKAVKKWQDDLGLAKTGTVELGRVVYTAGPVRVDTHKAKVGDTVQQGTGILTHTATSRVITVELKTSERRLARPGAPVQVSVADGKTIPGRIAKVDTFIDTDGNGGGNGDGGDGGSGGGGGSGDSETKLKVTITVQHPTALTGFDQATADVAFSASARTGVLTVPVAALLALAEGGYGVQVVAGSSTRIVAVRTGLFAGGRVEITGAGLTAGMTVGMPA